MVAEVAASAIAGAVAMDASNRQHGFRVLRGVLVSKFGGEEPPTQNIAPSPRKGRCFNAQACFDARESFPSWATTLTDRSDQYHLDAVCLDKSTGRQVS